MDISWRCLKTLITQIIIIEFGLNNKSFGFETSFIIFACFLRRVSNFLFRDFVEQNMQKGLNNSENLVSFKFRNTIFDLKDNNLKKIGSSQISKFLPFIMI